MLNIHNLYIQTIDLSLVLRNTNIQVLNLYLVVVDLLDECLVLCYEMCYLCVLFGEPCNLESEFLDQGLVLLDVDSCLLGLLESKDLLLEGLDFDGIALFIAL